MKKRRPVCACAKLPVNVVVKLNILNAKIIIILKSYICRAMIIDI